MGYLIVIWQRLDRTRDRNGARKGSGPPASARRICRALIRAGNIPAQSRVLVPVSPQPPQSSSRTAKGIKALVLTVSLSSPRLLMTPQSMYLVLSGHQFTGETGTGSPAPSLCSDNSCWFALRFTDLKIRSSILRSAAAVAPLDARAVGADTASLRHAAAHRSPGHAHVPLVYRRHAAL